MYSNLQNGNEACSWRSFGVSRSTFNDPIVIPHRIFFFLARMNLPWSHRDSCGAGRFFVHVRQICSRFVLVLEASFLFMAYCFGFIFFIITIGFASASSVLHTFVFQIGFPRFLEIDSFNCRVRFYSVNILVCIVINRNLGVSSRTIRVQVSVPGVLMYLSLPHCITLLWKVQHVHLESFLDFS